jgi:hypothetical protein
MYPRSRSSELTQVYWYQQVQARILETHLSPLIISHRLFTQTRSITSPSNSYLSRRCCTQRSSYLTNFSSQTPLLGYLTFMPLSWVVSITRDRYISRRQRRSKLASMKGKQRSVDGVVVETAEAECFELFYQLASGAKSLGRASMWSK